ncbi:hypothetical protein OG785_04895 [Streptomyces sp. NBC_00006]|uniref:hypothetical protein n=1 Tax=unclassified Streptomyces TaxID=2593676 RepID=UPI00224F6D9B|nr:MULTISPECIES: hypothetical protein [unclassified Streptomyces]MCX4834193.1 hypothetical protein [Streptomyces sp. NBC_01016]MCX5529896.1 hypothetical protein [Streptomyces sp. NBC_00006]
MTGRPTGVRLFTRAPVTLAWLSASVVPVARSVQESGGAVVRLRRGWLHGPHVDVIGRGALGQELPWSSVAQRMDAGPLPADRALNEAKYLEQAREFGRLEAVAPPYLPMREHGDVEFLGPDEGVVRDPLLRDLREAEIVHGVLCPPLMNTIDEVAKDRSLATPRLAEAFLALGDSYFLGLAHGAFSFRSHAEAFFAWAAPSKDMRPVFAARLAKEAPVLRALVEQRLAGRVGPAAAEWRTAFAYSTGTLDSAVMDGRLTPAMLDAVNSAVDNTGTGPPTAPEVVPQGTHPDTAFHRAAVESGVIDDPTPWFAAYRLLINLFYQQLPLLAVSPIQRYYMCYALAETIDEVLGETWQERLDKGRVRWEQTQGAAR